MEAHQKSLFWILLVQLLVCCLLKKQAETACARIMLSNTLLYCCRVSEHSLHFAMIPGVALTLKDISLNSGCFFKQLFLF